MKPCAVYHWWGSSNDAPPYANLRAPILLSIATLRAVCDIPIIVLDMTYENEQSIDNDWLHFPDKLKFTVEKTSFHYLKDKQYFAGWRHLSRIPDVYHHMRQYTYDTVVYVDSDVFFFQSPFPLAGDTSKFCFNGWNTGFYYYDQQKNDQFFRLFEAYATSAIFNTELRPILKKHVSYDAWYEVWDEMLITYMLANHPELFSLIPTEEHTTASTIQYAKLNEIKMFHANGTMMHNPAPKNTGEKYHCRGLLPLIINEFYQNLVKVLDEDDLKYIFTRQELTYRNQRVNLLDNINKLSHLRAKDGHYHAHQLIRQPVLFI